MAQINLTRNQRKSLENFRDVVEGNSKPSLEEIVGTLDTLSEIVLQADDFKLNPLKASKRVK